MIDLLTCQLCSWYTGRCEGFEGWTGADRPSWPIKEIGLAESLSFCHIFDKRNFLMARKDFALCAQLVTIGLCRALNQLFFSHKQSDDCGIGVELLCLGHCL